MPKHVRMNINIHIVTIFLTHLIHILSRDFISLTRKKQRVFKRFFYYVIT